MIIIVYSFDANKTSLLLLCGQLWFTIIVCLFLSPSGGSDSI